MVMNFLADSLDMNIDRACIADVFIAPDLIQKLLARENTVWLGGQEIQKLQLLGGMSRLCPIYVTE